MASYTIQAVVNAKTFNMVGNLESGDAALFTPSAVEATLTQHDFLAKIVRELGALSCTFGVVITSLSVTWNVTVFDIELKIDGDTFSMHSDLAIDASPSVVPDIVPTDTSCLKAIVRLITNLGKLGRVFGVVITSFDVAAV